VGLASADILPSEPLPANGQFRISGVRDTDLSESIEACIALIQRRFPMDDGNGAAARLLHDGTIVTGTAPNAANPSVEVCHEIEPYCAASV
jgi:hypothetical protein